MSPANDNALSDESDLALDATQDHPPLPPAMRAREVLRGLVYLERERQDARWGTGTIELRDLPAVLGEEVGEVIKAVNDVREGKPGASIDAIVDELVQVAAVVEKWVMRCPRLREAVRSRAERTRL